MKQHFILTVMCVLTLLPGCLSQCHQGINCNLPTCFCPATRHTLDEAKIPQIIYFGFDDALNVEMAKYYRRLFSPDRKNPNGCPISMSLYVQHNYTDYNLVNEFYNKGMEIGVHSVTHSDVDTAEKLRYEADQQRKNLANFGSIPITDIVGWRSPNLKTAGDVQPDILKELGYEYDISLTFPRSKLGQARPWPYTLDYGYPHRCMVEPCPNSTSSHPGFWEVPINSLVDYKNAYPCVYVDGCYNRPDNEEQAYKYLWQNFKDYYVGSRTPLGFNMHAAWFWYPQNLRAMDRFIKRLLEFDDVYIVTVKQLLDWMRVPTPLSQIKNIPSWTCHTNPVSDPISNSQTRITTVTSVTTTTTLTTTTTSATTTAEPLSCIQGSTCKLPNCMCRTTLIPNGIPKQQTPQMVYFNFDGPVTYSTYTNLKNLFASGQKNPNNCSISATMFVPKRGNSLSYLQELSAMGLEVGLRGDSANAYVNSKYLEENLVQEINYFEEILQEKSPKGWRSPALKSLGDAQYKILESNKLMYDSTLSLPIPGSWKSLPWPYTLDFTWQDRCVTGRCPEKSYPGLWEVPVVPILDYRKQYVCVYADGCLFNPQTADDTYNFLWNNFLERYNGNRSPFGITFRQQWFSHPVYKPNVEGLNRFIKVLVSMSDVYIVSIENIILWMKNPTPLAELATFEPWKC